MSSNPAYEKTKNHHLDGKTVLPDAILPEESWQLEHFTDLELERGMTWATRDAHERELQNHY